MLVKSSILLAGVTNTEQEYYAQSYAWLEVLCSNKPHKKVWPQISSPPFTSWFIAPLLTEEPPCWVQQSTFK